MINARFGTWRGAIRLGLSYIEVATGQAAIVAPSGEVRRLVFVCHGNICRSAFAEHVARRAGINTASFGLSTSADMPAHTPMMAAAERLGYDLTNHRTTRAQDFSPIAGDLLLGMEVRHLRGLARDERLGPVPRSLLGLWTAPPLPHIHDPFELDPAYMTNCLRRIESAIPRLKRAFTGAAL